MNLAAIMDELSAAVNAIDGLRSQPYYAERVTPPIAVVGWPDSMNYDQTMGRGSDRAVIPLIVVVGKADARSSRDRLAQYLDGSGPQSIKQAIESHTPASYYSAHVESAEVGSVTIAATAYLSATFDIEISGKGA